MPKHFVVEDAVILAGVPVFVAFVFGPGKGLIAAALAGVTYVACVAYQAFDQRKSGIANE